MNALAPREIRDRMVDNGWVPLPCSGKACYLPGWTGFWDQVPTSDDLDRWDKHEAWANTGIACGLVVGVDLDADDQQLADVLKAVAFDILGMTDFIRVGRPGRYLLAYRAAGDVQAAKHFGKIEILGRGNQFIAYGVHPDTGQPYRWVGAANPVDDQIGAAPEITQAHVDRFVEAAKGLLQLSQGQPNDAARTAGIEHGGSGRVVNGREQHLTNCVYNAACTLYQEGGYGQLPGAEAIAERAWMRFQETTELDRSKHDGQEPWAPKDALTKAQALVGHVESGIKLLPREVGWEHPWPAPEPLPDMVPLVVPFDPQLLPPALCRWVMDTSERLQAPPDYSAVAAMVALATVVGRRIGIRPKRHDDWLVVPNLWGMIVGRPGVMKTPALMEPMRSLLLFESEAAAAHKVAMGEWQVSELVLKEAESVAKKNMRDAIKKNGDPAAIARSLLESSDTAEPRRTRYVVNDTTIEKLGEILRDNIFGVLMFRDELIGFLVAMDKDGHESARAFYLEAWNGNSRFTYDRIGRGTIDIEAACVSILGGIQPATLAGYMAQNARSGRGDDGLLQRIQLAVYPDVSTEWHNVDRQPDRSAQAQADAVYRELVSLDPGAIGAARTDTAEIPYLRFADDAQDAFDEWRADLEHRIRSGVEHPSMEAHLAKYRSLVPSLALLIHLVEGEGGPVSLGAVTRAAAWAEYLESHARRIYAAAIRPELVAANAFASRIARGELPSPFSLRDIYRNGWTRLTTREEAEDAVGVLIDHQWLREVKIATGGRPTIQYHVNPAIMVGGK